MSSQDKYRLWYLRYKQDAVYKLTFNTEAGAREKVKALQRQTTVQRVAGTSLNGHYGVANELSDRSCKVTDWIIMKNFEIIAQYGEDIKKTHTSNFKMDIDKKKAAMRRKKNKKQKAKKEKEQQLKQEAKRKMAQDQGKEICSCSGMMALRRASSVANCTSCDQCKTMFSAMSQAWICEDYRTQHPALCVQCMSRKQAQRPNPMPPQPQIKPKRKKAKAPAAVKKPEPPKHFEEAKDDKLVKLQDDYNIMTAQFSSLQMEVNRLKANNDRLTRDKDELKRQCDSLDTQYQMRMNAQMAKVKELQRMNTEMTQEKTDYHVMTAQFSSLQTEVKRLKSNNQRLTREKDSLDAVNKQQKLKMNAQMEQWKHKEEEKKEEDVGVEEKCKVSFKRWLHEIVNLGRYFELFEKNQSDDIRYIEFFDEDTIKNEIGIKHVIHSKFIMKKINEFKKKQMAFNVVLETHPDMRSYKTQFEVNGILTMEQLKNQIKTKKDLANVLQMKSNDTNVDVLWNALFSKQKEISPMIAPKNNEGNITAYI